MFAKHTIVISIDAFTGTDLKAAFNLPAFSRLLKNCAMVESVLSVYPSLTYPCHVSMVTGCWPERTGVINNEHFISFPNKRPWYLYSREIACPTIFDHANKAGISTGCVMWPCMGNAPVDYLVPEIWGDTPDSGFYEPFRTAGTPELIDELWSTLDCIAKGFTQPDFDSFAFACGMEVLKRKKPRLLYVHICQIDNAKHYHGLNSPQLYNAIKNTDALLSQLLSYLDETGLADETNIILCSDHGQVEVNTASFPNLFFKQQGLIEVQGNNIISYKAQSHSACCSAQVYCKNSEAEASVEALLEQENIRDKLGISAFYTKAQAKSMYHLDGNFSFILEGKDGIFFKDDVSAPALTMPLSLANVQYKANHGHDPVRSDAPIFLLTGPGVRIGSKLKKASLIDEPATVAKLCGFSMPDIQGRVLSELLL